MMWPTKLSSSAKTFYVKVLKFIVLIKLFGCIGRKMKIPSLVNLPQSYRKDFWIKAVTWSS